MNLLKRIDMPLRHVPNLVTTCICLHNLSIVHQDKLDDESERIMHKMNTNQLGQLGNIDIFMTTTRTAIEMRSYLKIEEVETCTMQIKDFEETMVYVFENIREDRNENLEIVKTKRTDRFK